MTRKGAIAILAIGGTAGICAGATRPAVPGVANPERAQINWMLKCQGCHQPNADSMPNATPPMAGMVARFLHAPGGREYLVRVPGVATSTLTDEELAELLNWSLYRFDRTHVPADFVPYSATEVRTMRRQPLRTEAAAVRAKLVKYLNAQPRHPRDTRDGEGI